MTSGFRLPTAVDDLSNAATDPTWPILARLRFAWMLANIGEADRATAAFYALGSSFNQFVVDDVLALTRDLADDERFIYSASGVWDVADLVPRQRHTETVDPRDLWGLAMAMLLAAAGLPDTVRLQALSELEQLGHPDEAARIARGMLRERRGNDDMVNAVRAYLDR
jgi:HEAT repeat protein